MVFLSSLRLMAPPHRPCYMNLNQSAELFQKLGAKEVVKHVLFYSRKLIGMLPCQAIISF